VIRVLIAAPSAVVRAGLEALAVSHAEWQIVGSFPDLSGVEALQADVVLAAILLEEAPVRPGDGTPPLVLLTNEAHPVWTAEAFRQGVRALLPRDAPQQQILAAVEAVAGGFALLDPRDLEALLSSAPQAVEAGRESALTARELEVLRLLAEGAANKIIAWKLGISEHTVKFHVASILAKLGASSRTEAVAIGVRTGLVML
jgi:DNA-binding NarL/FixJ family response regulator